MFISQKLSQFLDDNGSGSELEEKYTREDLVKMVKEVMGHSPLQLLAGNSVSYTDLQWMCDRRGFDYPM